jgi:CheY-like chemotaxis protein
VSEFFGLEFMPHGYCNWRCPESSRSLTAYASSVDEEMCRDAGCDAFIPKPVDAAKLVSKLLLARVAAAGVSL